MKIQYGSRFGNFKWIAEADIADALIPTLLQLGCLQLGQRSPSTAAEKEMAGYEKRPAKFERDSIDFSDEAAAILAKHLSAMKVETGRNEKDEPIFATIEADVKVEKYEGSTADVKMLGERAAYGRHSADLADFAKLVGYAGELGDGKAENAPVAFLRAIKAYIDAQLKAL